DAQVWPRTLIPPRASGIPPNAQGAAPYRGGPSAFGSGRVTDGFLPDSPETSVPTRRSQSPAIEAV
ncbi:MAG: hypothetical protein ACQETP_09370, partial [Bacteroidota bacterium]